MGGGDLRGSMHPRQTEQIPPFKSPSFSFSAHSSCLAPSLLLLFHLLLPFCPLALFSLFPSALRALGVPLCRAPLRSCAAAR